MLKHQMKWVMALVVCVLCLGAGAQNVQAEELSVTQNNEYSHLTETPPMLNSIIPSMDKNGKVNIKWYSNAYSSEDGMFVTSYEIEMATNTQFTNVQKFTSDTNVLNLDKSNFGENGGKFYIRVRSCVKFNTGVINYSNWSEMGEYIFVAINKNNFPGLYKLLKNGGGYYSSTGVKEIIYDKNKDGWLDPEEINDLTMLGTVDITTKKNGKYHTTKAIQISSLQGIEHLKNVSVVSLARFSGKKIDLSKNKVMSVNIRVFTSKQLEVIAPDAKMVSVQADYSKKVTKIDLSQCDNAVDVLAYGSKGTKILKLPNNKTKMKILSLSDFGTRIIDVNAYKNLQQLYLYKCDIKKLKINKCKNLRYLYFYYCEKIKSLNIVSNKKLVGADFYETKGLTKKTIKKSGKCRITWNKGKWWYYTKKYKNDVKNLYK